MTQQQTTSSQVADAAAAIERDGQIPSIRRVITRLGGGSPNYIGPLLKEWKNAQQSPALPPIEIDHAVVDAIVRQIRAVSLQASSVAVAERREAEDNAELLAKSCQGLEAQLQTMKAEFDAASARVQQQQGLLEARERELEDVRTDSAAAIAESRASAIAERAIAEELRQNLVRSTIRIEALPRLEEGLKDREQRIDAAKDAVAQARRAEAVALAQLEAAKQHAQEASEREAIPREQLSSLQATLADAWKTERSLHIEVQRIAGEAASSQRKLDALEARLAQLVPAPVDDECQPPNAENHLAA